MLTNGSQDGSMVIGQRGGYEMVLMSENEGSDFARDDQGSGSHSLGWGIMCKVVIEYVLPSQDADVARSRRTIENTDILRQVCNA